MPIHIHPHLRALEEAEETEGLIKTLDSVGLTVLAAAEAAGTRIPKLVPVQQTRIIRGHSYTAS